MPPVSTVSEQIQPLEFCWSCGPKTKAAKKATTPEPPTKKTRAFAAPSGKWEEVDNMLARKKSSRKIKPEDAKWNRNMFIYRVWSFQFVLPAFNELDLHNSMCILVLTVTTMSRNVTKLKPPWPWTDNFDFTHKRSYTQMSDTEVPSPTGDFTQTNLLHRDTIDTKMFLHTGAHRCPETNMFLHRNVYTAVFCPHHCVG